MGTARRHIRHILVIEDDGEMRRLLEDVLTREGFVVFHATNGSEARLRLRENSYRIIVLDRRLADASGLEMLPDIKETQPDAQVIMMSASGDQRTYREAMEKGATACLAKPFSMSVLVGIVKRAVESILEPER
jgi:DNA-binding NtrC family response regulator